MKRQGSKRRQQLRRERQGKGLAPGQDAWSHCKRLTKEGQLKEIRRLYANGNLVLHKSWGHPGSKTTTYLLHLSLLFNQYSIWEFLVSLPQSWSVVARSPVECVGCAQSLKDPLEMKQAVDQILEIASQSASAPSEPVEKLRFNILNGNYCGFPVLAAAKTEPAVDILVQLGADVNLRAPDYLPEYCELSILDLCSSRGQLERVQALDKNHAHIGSSTIHAAMSGYVSRCSSHESHYPLGNLEVLSWLKIRLSPEIWLEAAARVHPDVSIMSSYHWGAVLRYLPGATLGSPKDADMFQESAIVFKVLHVELNLPFNVIALVLDLAHLNGWAVWEKTDERDAGSGLSLTLTPISFVFAFARLREVQRIGTSQFLFFRDLREWRICGTVHDGDSSLSSSSSSTLLSLSDTPFPGLAHACEWMLRKWATEVLTEDQTFVRYKKELRG